MAINLAFLFFQEGRCGGATTTPSIRVHILCPVVSPGPGEVHAPALHQYLDLSSALVVHGTLAHEAGVSGAVGVLGWTVGR